MTAFDPNAVKACCAAAYGKDAVALLLGDSYHPGGLTLTRRLADLLDIQAGCRVVDVACGPGTTARLLAAEYGAEVDGVDLNPSAVDVPGVRIHRGDAERIPLPNAVFDVVVCECAFCTFPDKSRAAAEFARLLRPGGRVGITDVTVAGELPDELHDLAAWVACIADARSLKEYAVLLENAGLRVTHDEAHDAAIGRMLDQIQARLSLLSIIEARAHVDLDVVAHYLDRAQQAVTDAIIGYGLLVAEKVTV
jgi:ubiquinone/menaquinone biosynthesis C-methylase UbiE